MTISRAHPGCLLRLRYRIPNKSGSFVCQWKLSQFQINTDGNISESYFKQSFCRHALQHGNLLTKVSPFAVKK